MEIRQCCGDNPNRIVRIRVTCETDHMGMSSFRLIANGMDCCSPHGSVRSVAMGNLELWLYKTSEILKTQKHSPLQTRCYIAFHFARAKCHVLICTKVLPKVIDEQNFNPHATGPHRPTAHVVNVSCAKPGNKNKASKSNLLTNYCKLRLQHGNTPIFAKAC